MPRSFPITLSVHKLAVALASGCSIILKAPEQMPAAPAALIEAYVDAGVLAESRPKAGPLFDIPICSRAIRVICTQFRIRPSLGKQRRPMHRWLPVARQA
jgi:hypothetical protein